jgi:hypothetical protein
MMGSIFDKPGGDADDLNRKDYLNRESYIKEKYDVDPKERDKRLDKLLKNYLKDQKLVENYGEDAMKSKGFNSPNRPQTPGLYRPLSEEEKQSRKKGRGVAKKAKGGAVKNYKHGGAVMKGRGGSFKGIK